MSAGCQSDRKLQAIKHTSKGNIITVQRNHITQVGRTVPNYLTSHGTSETPAGDAAGSAVDEEPAHAGMPL